MTTNNNEVLVISLTDMDSSSGNDSVSPSRVGGKASSLAMLYATDGLGSRVTVPKAYALTVDFFRPWIDKLTKTKTYRTLAMELKSYNSDIDIVKVTDLCLKLKAAALGLGLSQAQSNAIRSLADQALKGTSLAAVRSSAPEEDGIGASFAGILDSKLGVATTYEGLKQAIHECFASLWDYRVFSYKQRVQVQMQNKSVSEIGFAVIVMEMVDSVVAGVAFSANPLNSDRDELVIDSSWGLGESVVDGSVTADRFVVDKINRWKILEKIPGKKGLEKRLGNEKDGGVMTMPISEDNSRCSELSLSSQQVEELSELVCLVETTYGMPMDVEWAFATEVEGNTTVLKPKLLQARPITTLYTLDQEMMTEPGEKRLLYFDSNVATEATTTSPFRTMDLDCMNSFFTVMLYGGPFGDEEVKEYSYYGNHTDRESIMYNGNTRQYYSMNWVLGLVSGESVARMMEGIDPYFASIVRSKDYDAKKYKTCWLPKGLPYKSLTSLISYVVKQGKVAKKYREDPKGAKELYLTQVETNMKEFHKIQKEDSDANGISLLEYSERLMKAIGPIFNDSSTVVMFVVVGLLNEINKERREGKTEEIKQVNEALCGGFEGDGLMEMNIALYRLAHLFPMALWKDYNGENGMTDLAERIQKEQDLPDDFLTEWKLFLDQHGYDGQDQLFVGCPRYVDKPELLLQKMKLTVMGSGKDPSVKAKELLEKRRHMMTKLEEEAKKELENAWLARRWSLEKNLATVRNRNEILEHLVWMRNSPKLEMTKFFAAIRVKVLKIEEQWMADGRLEETGDIFHLKMAEVDQGLLSSSLDLMEIVRPRKVIYKRAVSSNMCPILVDSRCRILQPDPPAASTDPGTLVGTAISPGIATGKVKIINDLSLEQTRGFGIGANGEREEHILCAVVTGPAWTPLFSSASAVILQVGGALQHGALCAREYGKPAVSNIAVHKVLKDGMTVSVDGNRGVVTILDDGGK